MKTSLIIAAAALAIPALAFAQSTPTTPAMNMGGSPADQANMKAMEKMHDSMPKKGMGDADKDFVSMMLPHHQGAVDMAKVELQYGKDPMLKKMAEDIVKSQEKEISELKQWQGKNMQ